MRKMTRNFLAFALMAGFVFTTSQALAKKEGSPPGWEKGEKTGWDGGSLPPGLAKKEAAGAEEKAEKPAKKAEKKPKKTGKKGKKQAD